ncbi:aldehyde dehydrogenase family protein [Hyphomicrobium sp.]|uniref:aldehyde dehydrogenase family protein n=1 Tax=Hyphomicrobium sp. TaxID=82 RepID=UPI001DDBD54C|nr:aldehyde dehydrogenase family protein [Hyphomicrobium sp.]MBY0558822.1 aldehyde dehydrogenase family protein [Hyphomicrobium sp.]
MIEQPLNGTQLASKKTIDFLSSTHKLLIDGNDVLSAAGETLRTYDPALKIALAEVPNAKAADVDAAVTAATSALHGSWQKMSPMDRSQILLRLADLIERDTTWISEVESLDSGKPKHQIAAVDVRLAINALRYYAGWCTKLAGETIPASSPELLVYTRREPVGVVAAIVPWNFPLCQACFKIAPALAAGCTVILKPAEQTPLSALILGRLALEAGLPPGVLNILTGDGATTGQALVEHPGVAKITFTGSERVGKHIARIASATLKRVSLELGGKNPHIIFADGDVDTAAVTAAGAIFFYAGQVCSAGSRLMVEAKAFDRVVNQVVSEASKLKMGHGLHTETTLGPLISEDQLKRVSGFVERSRDTGIEVVTGGRRGQGTFASGSFYEPTVLTGAKDTDGVVSDEIFGPVLAIQTFESFDELVKRANTTSYGLAAGIWTSDVAKAHAAAAAIQAGTVWINTYNQFDAAVGWGGFKQSGYGKDNGREGIEQYLQTKTVWVNYARG